MTLVLARIDQRLIHGQVTVGWKDELDYDRILVADDVLAADEWERDLLASAAPDGVAVEVLDVASAGDGLAAGVPGRTLLLVRSVASMLALVRAEAGLDRVNVGGLYYREGARRFLDYVFVTREDVEALGELAAHGVRLEARDLPGHPATDLNEALAEGRLEYDRLRVRDS